MIRLAFSSLRTRLSLLLLLAVAPLLILILYNAAESRSAAAVEAQLDALRITRFAATTQSQFIEQTRQLLVNLARAPELRASGAPTCRDAFSLLQTQYLQQRPRYTNLGLIDPEGRIYCSVETVSGPINIADRDYFQRTVQTFDLSYGDYEYDPVTGKTFVNFVYPVLDFSGRPRVIVFAALDLAWLNQLATQAQLPAGSTFTLLDRSGRILIRYPDPGRWVGQTLPETPIVEAILTRRAEGAAEATDVDGLQRLYAFTPLAGATEETPAAYVSIGIPSEVAYAEGNSLLIRNLIALGLVTIVVLGASVAFGNAFILRPVQALVEATHRLGAGDLSARTGLSMTGEQSEIGQLAHAFDRMAETLQQRQVERDRVEHELRTSEERYRTLARNFPNGAVILFDRDLRYILADGAGLPDIGLSKESLEGQTIWELFSPETCALLEPNYRAALAGERRSFETVFSGRTYLVYALPLRDERGEIIAGMAMTQDITTQKQAEARLRASEAEMRALFSAMTDVIIVFDSEGRCLEIAPTNPSLLYQPASEMIGKTLHEIFPPAQADASLKPIREALNTGRTIEIEYSLPIGEREVWFAASISPMSENTVILVARDITERKQAREALQTSEARFRSAFDNAAIGMALVAPDGAFLQVNRAYCNLVGYSEAEMLSRTFLSITHPDDAKADLEAFDRLLAGQISHYEMEKRYIHKQEYIVWGLLSVSLVRDARGQPLYTVSQVQDITLRKLAEESLRAAEQQYRSIFEATTDGLLINDLETGRLVDNNPAAATMHGYTLEEFRALEPAQFVHPDSMHLFLSYLDTVRAGHPFRAQAVNVRKDGTPLHVEVFGTGFLYRGKPHALGVFRDITERVQAQQILEQRVEERTRELAALLEVSRNVASTLELKPLLGLILDQLKTLVNYQSAALFALQEDRFVLLDYRGPLQGEQLRHPLEWWTLNQDAIRRREPIIIADVRGDTPLARKFQAWAGESLETAFGYIRSMLGIPLTIKEWAVGMMSLTYDEPGYYTDQQLKLAMGIATQAAVAIENARLYEQAQQLAALEERQKLARELHDSVSQALYGIALGARTARTLLDRDPGRITEPLDYVLSLAEAGLAEMRALIFELRPESLEAEGLVAALTKQAASLRARHQLEVSTLLKEEPQLPLAMKEAIYRIAQEALHNVAKHARATRVELRLELMDGVARLEVNDNGAGFDPQASFPGHLGLQSMRERAEKIGGTLEIESAPGQGTRVTVCIPLSQN